MTKHEAFHAQAESDLAAFDVLLAQDRVLVPACHPLHYLQMATEKLAKAWVICGDPSFNERNHAAVFPKLHDALKGRQDIARLLGYTNAAEFDQFLDRTRSLLDEIKSLCPSPRKVPDVSVEYPWETAPNAWVAPAKYEFVLLSHLQANSDGVALMTLVRQLISKFGTLCP